MTKLFSNYKRAAIDFASAQGNYLTDTTGKTYLDFSSGIGVTNLGYHPRVNQALTDQVGKICTSLTFITISCKKMLPVFNW